MGANLSNLDLIIFFGSLLAVMAVGLWAGRKEETSADFYLAGRTTRWWGVAGSIFGSNVSANHIVGMMGVGFSVGFAQSHFEITAIAGLLLLCYGFLPVYRKLNVYTLSEYLSRRYDDSSRVAYALIMIVIMVVIQMVPGFYIGSRSLNILLQEGTGAIDPTAYRWGIILMAAVTGTYTILGGLKAVIMTDVIQSVLLLAAGLLVAFLTFSQPEVGGWAGMRALDSAPNGRDMMHLYLPSDHGQLPWTGVLTGLMILHFYYWGTNQFVVQRALAARSDGEARFGIITAGFFKLLIPFFSIGTGIAAYYMFKERGMNVAQDAAFPQLMIAVVKPVGFGIVGLVAAGLVGAILSSLDSMMNSASTIVTFDLYKRYVNPEASEKTLILVGRICIAVFIAFAAALTIFIMDPNSEDSFFLQIASHQSKLIAGVVVAFGLGMLWKRATGAGAIVAILAGVGISYALPPIYANTVESGSIMYGRFGPQLNFMHSVFVAAVAAAILHVVVRLCTQPDPEKGKLTWLELGGHSAAQLKRAGLAILVSLCIYGVVAVLVVEDVLAPQNAGILAAAWTFALFAIMAFNHIRQDGNRSILALLLQDRLWAGVLAALAVFMMYNYF